MAKGIGEVAALLIGRAKREVEMQRILVGQIATQGLGHRFQVAVNLRGQVLGHDVELDNQDDGCSADGGQSAMAPASTRPCPSRIVTCRRGS